MTGDTTLAAIAHPAHDHDHHDHAHHDHGEGAAGLLSAAEEHCRRQGVRLTDLRRTVLEALVKAPGTMGAYDLIDALAQDGGRRLAPISIYRALDFLVEVGLVHKIQSRNAFVACPHRHGADDVVTFLICDTCGRVEEATSSAVSNALTDVARRHGFEPRGQVIEMAGRCGACQPAQGGVATA
jgi:Fur family transcriptional regulator, zinc uptake regulator